MLLHHILSQLAILGATSIVLRNGSVVELADADRLLAETDESLSFAMCVREWWVDILDAATGRLLGRAATLWHPRAEKKLAVAG
jgi:hypothetical protein